MKVAAGRRLVLDDPTAAAPTATYRRRSPRPLPWRSMPAVPVLPIPSPGLLGRWPGCTSPRLGAGWPGPGKSAAVQSPCRRGDGRVEAVALPL